MKTKVILSLLVLTGLLFVNPVFAQSNSPSPLPGNRGLVEGALRACQARESGIKNRMDSLVKLATNMEKVFDSIASRVESFYTNKVLPSGKTVGSYDALVAAISTKKGIVDTDLATAQNLVTSFSCTSGDPRSLLAQFRLDMQKVKQDLKDYRTAIKNLIVAVRGVAPTLSPTATP